MNLGLPYKGGKNTIAEDIVKKIPRGGKILDACCGGGAFLMAAAMSLRWEKVVGNALKEWTERYRLNTESIEAFIKRETAKPKKNRVDWPTFEKFMHNRKLADAKSWI